MVTRGAEERSRPVSLLRDVAEEEDISIDPNGFYVPPKDPAALQRAITFLLEHPEDRARLGAAGRRAVERLMTVDQFAERIARVIEMVTTPPDDRPSMKARPPHRTTPSAQTDGTVRSVEAAELEPVAR